MKKFLTLVVALVAMMPLFAAKDGSTKPNAIDFSWDSVNVHTGGMKWYKVDLAPLYEEDSPALNLFLANPDPFKDVEVSLQATVAGQSESAEYTIKPKQQKAWSANASMLVRLKQTEIYLTLSTGENDTVYLSARVFEAADLDEACEDALTFNWASGITKPAGVPVWYKVDLRNAKATDSMDVCVIVTNNGTKALTLKAGQSLDCPSSGVTKRTIELAAGQTLRDTIPHSMINSVAYDELYVSLENDRPISVRAEFAKRPAVPVLPAELGGPYVDKSVPDTATHESDTLLLDAGVDYYFRYTVAELNALKKYEPEFTFRNPGTEPAVIDRKMAFEVPAFVAQGNVLELAAGEEQVEVITKNTLLGLTSEYIYIKIRSDKQIQLISRFKHVREGKACKTNIDFGVIKEENVHAQEGGTTQWYAIDLDSAKNTLQDVVVYIKNESAASAKVKASMAFSCPYIDLMEVSRTLDPGETIHRRMPYSSYAMMSSIIYIGLETSRDVKFWAKMVDTEKNAVADSICLDAQDFDWEQGADLAADTSVWYRIDMTQVRDLAAKFPTVFVQNLSSTDEAVITAELSLDCPDSIKNESRSLTIAANSSYTKQLSRNMFENIKSDTIYLKVHSTQHISLQIRLNEEAEGASCLSAIPFNWVSGNIQAANANVWYSIDLRNVMQNGNDLKLHVENRDNASCKGIVQLAYECPVEAALSTQDFTFNPKEQTDFTVPNSLFDMIEDSVVYINVQSTTSLRIWADTLEVQPFDTIFGDNITLIPLMWDSLYTLDVDTAWYIIPQSEIEKIRNAEDKVKPVAHLINLSGFTGKIRGEAAFGFPITKGMMESTIELKAGQHTTDTIPAGTFDQFLKKDSIIIRVTRPLHSGVFQFRAELVKAFSGNTRTDALPIRMDQMYTQSPNTEMWYRLNTAELKKPDLYNKILNVYAKSAGATDTKVQVAIYDGLLAETDLFEEYGLDDYRERTIKKGESGEHNIPAQIVYGLGNVEMYIKVRTTDSIVFSTKFNGEYKAKAVDPEQAKAKLVVPNVDYIIPGDNKAHWYMFCLPYIQNNYVYSAESALQYEVEGEVTIETTATFQDNMDCAMPVRQRTVNKGGKKYVGTKPLSELLTRGLEEAGVSFDISSFQPAFIDSLLHRFITKDSVTLYVRIKSSKEIKGRLITPQVTGDACGNPMHFDWEHGNVNPADSMIWYHVQLADKDANDALIPLIPDTCDLRLHVDNWSNAEDSIQADLYFDCNDPKTEGKSYILAASGKDSIDIDRDFLDKLGWADLLINLYSAQPTHIWAELIPAAPRDTLRDTIVAYVCYGEDYQDTITGELHGPIEAYTEWYDTVTVEDGVTMKDSITWFQIHPIVLPEVITPDSMKKLDAAPLLVQGMQLYVETSNAALDAYYKALGAAHDSIIDVDTVYWAKPRYKANGELDLKNENPLDLDAFYPKGQTSDSLLIVIKGSCGQVLRQPVVFPVEDYKYVSKHDTVCSAPAVNPDTVPYAVHQHLVADTLGRDRQIDSVYIFHEKVLPTLYTKDQVTLLPVVANGAAIDTTATLSSLKQQFADDAEALTMKVVDAKWQVLVSEAWQDMPYTVGAAETPVTLRYVVETECGDVLNSANFVFDLTPPLPPCDNDTAKMPIPVEACGSFKWPVNGVTYTSSVSNFFYDYGLIDGCSVGHQFYELNLIIYPAIPETVLPAVDQCESYTHQWVPGVDTVITTSGNYKHHYTSINGCDSLVSIVVTIHHDTVVNVTDDVPACDSYNWKDAALGFDTTIVDLGTHTYSHLFTSIHNCDSLVNLTVTINKSAAPTTLPDTAVCDVYEWMHKGVVDTTILTSGTYTRHFQTVLGCDSAVTQKVTVNATPAPQKFNKGAHCNLFDWVEADTVIITEGTHDYTHVFTSVGGCDSVVTYTVTINVPYEELLPAIAKYNDRMLVIHRTKINQMKGWENVLDSLNQCELVTWYKMKGATPDPLTDDSVGCGYYYHNDELTSLSGSYYAYVYVEVGADAEEGACPRKGITKVLTCGGAAAAPALVPSLARPGENIQVINLDPTEQTVIRLYTAEGLLQQTYTVSGEESFTIQAANDYGFYMVELNSESIQSTLRYIVK